MKSLPQNERTRINLRDIERELEACARRPIPAWAARLNRATALAHQQGNHRRVDALLRAKLERARREQMAGRVAS